MLPIGLAAPPAYVSGFLLPARAAARVRRHVRLPAGGCLAGAELAQQVGGGLVGYAEAGAQRVPGDRLPVLVLVLGGGAARQREQGLVLGVLRRGRPSPARARPGVVVQPWPPPPPGRARPGPTPAPHGRNAV